VLAYTRGAVPDYQMAAFAMAVYFRGLSEVETLALTDAMVRSGETIDRAHLAPSLPRVAVPFRATARHTIFVAEKAG